MVVVARFVYDLRKLPLGASQTASMVLDGIPGSKPPLLRQAASLAEESAIVIKKVVQPERLGRLWKMLHDVNLQENHPTLEQLQSPETAEDHRKGRHT
jgi:hypothetical protein